MDADLETECFSGHDNSAAMLYFKVLAVYMLADVLKAPKLKTATVSYLPTKTEVQQSFLHIIEA